MAPPSAGKPFLAPRMVASISVFFHNNRDDGFGLRFTSNTHPTVVQVNAAIVAAVSSPAIADPALIAATEAELWQFARMSKAGALTPADACAAAGKIAWLSYVGALDSGEYNGLLYLDEHGALVKPCDGPVH